MTTPKTKFQQRHYEAIAEVMQRSHPGSNQAEKLWQWEVMRDDLSDHFRSDNRMFQPERFKAACVPGANVRSRRNPGPAMPYTNVDRGWPLTRKA